MGEADDGREAIRLAHDLTPDIVVMDIVMPNVNGIEATRQIVSSLPSIKVIALSIYAEDQFVDAMQDAGAVGYVLKQNAFTELPIAIRTVLEGGTYFRVGNKLLFKKSEIDDWMQTQRVQNNELDEAMRVADSLFEE